jgi:23S rRNA G2445 N2-methylase RlmL
MSWWKEKSKILIACPKGVSPYLKQEIEALQFPVLNEWDTAIQTEGTLQDTMMLNLHLRTAQRVLYQLETFIVQTPEMLYKKINAIPWENILHTSGRAAYLCVTSVADHPLITDSRFVNVKVKDAIVDRVRDQCGSRPDSGPDKDKAVIHVYWKNNRADVYLDTSGERLSLRGYRKIPLYAPMQETLAASVIMATGWKGETNFINPMCGSGTLAIEAVLMALNRAPGLSRNNYGFMYIKDFPEHSWQELRRQARNNAYKKPSGRIIATDIHQQAIDATKQNAQTAGVDQWIELKLCPFEKTTVPDGGGIMILNPPYGERMSADHARPPARDFRKDKETFAHGRKIILRKSSDMHGGDKHIQDREIKKLESTYQSIGDFFKSTGTGYSGYIFTGNLDLIKKVGLRTKRRLTFYNGEIECRLLEYELYVGSLKNKSDTGQGLDKKRL